MKNSKFLIVIVVMAAFLISGMIMSNAVAQSKNDDTKCLEPAKGPIGTAVAAEKTEAAPEAAPVQRAMVGGKAPDFEANAIHKGTFKNVKLSDYKGKWVVLCFYPGDFTFV